MYTKHFHVAPASGARRAYLESLADDYLIVLFVLCLSVVPYHPNRWGLGIGDALMALLVELLFGVLATKIAERRTLHVEHHLLRQALDLMIIPVIALSLWLLSRVSPEDHLLRGLSITLGFVYAMLLLTFVDLRPSPRRRRRQKVTNE